MRLPTLLAWAPLALSSPTPGGGQPVAPTRDHFVLPQDDMTGRVAPDGEVWVRVAFYNEPGDGSDDYHTAVVVEKTWGSRESLWYHPEPDGEASSSSSSSSSRRAGDWPLTWSVQIRSDDGALAGQPWTTSADGSVRGSHIWHGVREHGLHEVLLDKTLIPTTWPPEWIRVLWLRNVLMTLEEKGLLDAPEPGRYAYKDALQRYFRPDVFRHRHDDTARRPPPTPPVLPEELRWDQTTRVVKDAMVAPAEPEHAWEDGRPPPRTDHLLNLHDFPLHGIEEGMDAYAGPDTTDEPRHR